MCIKALEWARRQRTGSPTLKAVLRAVADYADEDGRAWPSQLRLADDTELTDRSVRQALKQLEEMGLLARTSQRRPDNSRATDIIMLALDRPEREQDSNGTRTGVPEGRSGTLPESGSGTLGRTFRYPNRKDVPVPPEGPSGPTTFEPPSNLQKIVTPQTVAAQSPTAEPLRATVSGVTDAAWHVMIEKLISLGVARPAAKSFLGKTLRSLGKRSGDLIAAVDEITERPWGDPLDAITEKLAIEPPRMAIHRKGKAAPQRKHVWPETFRDDFWTEYPNKKDKLKAIKVLEYLHKKDTISFEEIIAGVRRLKNSGTAIKYIPYAARYLRDERFRDEITPPQRNQMGPRRPSTQDLWANDAFDAHQSEMRNRDEQSAFGFDGAGREASGGQERHPARAAAHGGGDWLPSQQSGGDTGQLPPLRLVGGSRSER